MSETPSVRIERVLKAPIEKVFAAWTNPEMLRRWMSPPGTFVGEVSADVRPGGAFRLVMSGHGVDLEHTGEYQQVDPPRLLVFTWHSIFTGPEGSLVTVELESVEGGTRLLLSHERLPADQAAPHEDGWTQILSRLEMELATGAPS